MADSQVSATRARFIGIFVISLASLSFQVLLTRIFSVMLYYHFSFVGISLAMLGLTVGAQKVYLNPERFSPDRFNREWARAALGFALSATLLVLGFIFAPLALPDALIMKILIVTLLFFIIPFTYSGICITLILTRSAQVGKLYAADLIGAALGCMGIVALLFVFDPVTILFLLAAISSWAGLGMIRGESGMLPRKLKAVTLLLLVAAAVQGGLYLTDQKHLGIVWSKSGSEQVKPVVFERWNTFSRVRIMSWDSKTPFGWGFGHPQAGPVDQLFLDIDSQAGTILTHFDGDLKPLSFLADDIINMGYHIRPIESVAIIGVGGGRDILSALYFGARQITGVELNPSMLEALNRRFADFTGHLAQRAGVTLVNAEARSWLGQHRPKVDLVQISLIDTWAATAAGGLSLSENRLYTLEAWKEFLSLLNPKGMLVVSRWYSPKDYKGEFYRLLSLATESLVSQGVPRSEVRRHMLAFTVDRVVTVAISPTAFSPEEVAQISINAGQLGFAIAVGPDAALDETSRVIASGEATPAFYDSLPLDVTAPTDNRPFFFFMTRFSDALHLKPQYASYDITNNNSLLVIIVLMGGTLVVSVAFILDPLIKTLGRLPMREVLPSLGYFACIGIGFMLIEISQMQRLMVFLGHPVYGLSVVLFTLLVFGGLGSATVHDHVRVERLWKRPLFLCLVLAATGLLTPMLTAMFVPFGTSARILVSVLLLAPAGFCMGMMFPAGMLMSARHRELQPWFWGINGVMSVFASILGMALSMQFGIAHAFWCGVAVYAVSLLLARMNRARI